jgi:predicted metal-dependent hydrolase
VKILPLSYNVIRSSRKTVSLEICPDGSVLVRAPRRLSDRAIREFVTSKESWLREKLRKFENRPVLPRLTAGKLEKLKKQAKEDLVARVRRFAPQVGVNFGRITIRAQRTRWGSCSREGNLNFNCLLMLSPPEIRDYVVIHELCHRREMNHSREFWAQVEKVCPDYRRCRAWLKENGNGLIARLPGALADNAQLWSKEIENSAENLDALLDGAYTEPALTDANLLGLLR